MNKIVLKLTTAVSTAALLTGSVASVAFGTTTVTVTGNGADSNNTANVSSSNSTNVFQTNDANIQNNVTINANSGNNTANKNTGGNTSVSTGDANVSSSVSNSANSNVASVGCNTCAGSTDVKIAGNGADSTNTAKVDVTNKTGVTQANDANIQNNVTINANSGNNTANKNTGGNTSVSTGAANVTGNVSNDVNQNVAQVGGGSGGSFSAEISGNGADSSNRLNLDLGNDVQVFQNNEANIKNTVNVDAFSGFNTANKNTGGNTSVSTGDADVTVGVTNKANSNALDLSSCDCAFGGNVKIAGNGADSTNTANVTLGSALLATQTNDFSCGGDEWFGFLGGSNGNCAGVNVNSGTGGNTANKNTIHGSDPMVRTGDAGGDVAVSTQANSNTLGDLGNISLPNLPSDLNGLLVLLMGMFSSH